MKKEKIFFELDGYRDVEIKYKDVRAGLIQLLVSHYSLTEILFDSVDNSIVENLVNKVREHLSFKLDYEIIEFTDKELKMNIKFMDTNNEPMVVDIVMIKNDFDFKD